MAALCSPFPSWSEAQEFVREQNVIAEEQRDTYLLQLLRSAFCVAKLLTLLPVLCRKLEQRLWLLLDHIQNKFAQSDEDSNAALSHEEILLSRVLADVLLQMMRHGAKYNSGSQNRAHVACNGLLSLTLMVYCESVSIAHALLDSGATVGLVNSCRLGSRIPCNHCLSLAYPLQSVPILKLLPWLA